MNLRTIVVGNNSLGDICGKVICSQADRTSRFSETRNDCRDVVREQQRAKGWSRTQGDARQWWTLGVLWDELR